MSRSILIILIVAALAGQAPGRTNEMLAVTLSGPGQSRTIQFELAQPAHVSFQAFFPPTELGSLNFAVTDHAGQSVDAKWPRVLAKGKYTLTVSATGASPESFPLKISAAVPLDPYEPNDTRETASRVRVPLRAAIELHGRRYPDWFRFQIDSPHVLSVHLRPRKKTTVHFAVTDSEGKVLYATSHWADYLGARYVMAEPGEYFLEVWSVQSGAWTVDVELALYEWAPDATARGGFIALGMKPDSADFTQISLIAGATGITVVETLEPEVMRRELSVAIKAKPAGTADGSGLGWLWIVLLIAVLVAVGGAVLVRRRMRDRPAP